MARKRPQLKYQYTMLNQDGTKTVLAQSTKTRMGYKDIKKALNITSPIALIPQPYYPDEYADEAHNSIFGDDEGRFDSTNDRNPFTKVLLGDPMLGEPAEWDCVGNLLVETVMGGTVDDAESESY